MDNDSENKCEECLKEDESVKPNFIMHGFKLCDSCQLAKTIFPVYKFLVKVRITIKPKA